ncbi:hypothetical protein VZT92_019345 [Zoarces viviparus]|uniref:Secreted protein n=1 Tax=Zoarces viviparus TaxID=48416 RepID=A0AAW1ENL1_ZOAVI
MCLTCCVDIFASPVATSFTNPAVTSPPSGSPVTLSSPVPQQLLPWFSLLERKAACLAGATTNGRRAW